MNQHIVLVAETGSDITPALAEEYGIYLVPMHVSIGKDTLDDGKFPLSRIFDYYKETQKVPQTSAASPNDFEQVFDEIHTKWPEKQILHLAYSAVTTCSYQNALLAAEGRNYVTSVDTQHVSVGQAVVVLQVAQYLTAHPECQISEAVAAAERICSEMHMCFIPDNLDYLRAGGRVSNSVALVGNILSLHPCIEIIDGKLIAKKKYRGRTDRVIPKLLRDFTEAHHPDRSHLFFIWSPGLSDTSKAIAEEVAKELGYQKVTWLSTGCVITCHGGPGCIGIVGSSGIITI